MNYNEAKELMNTARSRRDGKPIGNNTRLYDNGNGSVGSRVPHTFNILLHDNRIITIFPEGMRISSAGYRTVTTKERLNRYLPAARRVFQKDFQWYLSTPYGGDPVPFVDDLFVTYGGKVFFDGRRDTVWYKYPEDYLEYMIANRHWQDESVEA